MGAEARSVVLVAGLAVLAAVRASAEPPGSVVDTLHNLSVSGPGEVRATSETQVCKFCHVPHTATLPVPLWGHRLSDTAAYGVPEVTGGGKAARPAPQPDGSSRLCLSCYRKKLYGWSMNLSIIMNTSLSHFHVTFTLRERNSRLRVISARDMHRKERTIYDAKAQEDS